MRPAAVLPLFLLGVSAQTACGLATAGGKRVAQSCGSSPPSRRSFLRRAVALGSAVIPIASQAQEDTEAPPDRGGRPFAPPQALLPATRLKLWVDRAYDLSSTLASVSDKNIQYDTLAQLDQVLSNPPKLFVSEKIQRRTSRPTAQIATGVSSADKEQYRRNRDELSMPDRLAAMLNQADVERQWGMLQFAESRRERGNEMRAAFNYYTSQLEFADSYLLTASREDRRRMIRNGELPSLTSVIASDLDLRDLYRNQFLTAIEDARAEVSYQVRRPRDSVDATDVVDLMNQANVACANWFGSIAPQDIREALDVVLKE